MILTVGECLVGRGSESLCGLLRPTKHRHVQRAFFPRDGLAVQSLSDAQRQNFLRGHFESKKGIVVAGNANHVGHYTKNRIRIDEKRVSFTAGKSD